MPCRVLPRRDRPRLLFGAVLLSVLSAAVAGAEERLRIAPPSRWVEPLPVDPGRSASAAETRSDSQLLLVDTQDNRLHPSRREFYKHVAWRILSPAGVQSGSTVQIDFDPSFDTLVIHSVRRHRDGTVTDLLDPAAIKVVQREQNLERHLYDGTRTALLFLEDTRVGDVIEYACTLIGGHPVFSGHFVRTLPLQSDVPIGLLRYRLLQPQGRPLYHRVRGQIDEPRRRRIDGRDEYEWIWRDVPASDPEPATPLWYDPTARFDASDFADWAAVAQWAAPLYRAPSAPAVKRRAAEIRAGAVGVAAQARAAVHFVQDEIRYLGITMGQGSHVPSAPELVLERRFGDCKDKSALLVALLRELGLEADVALVHTTRRAHVADELPSPLAFDHAIVRARIGDRTYWIDATESDQGGDLDHLVPPPYRRALVLRADTVGLSDVPPGPTGRIEVQERLRILAGDAGAHLSVETIYHGAEADRVRGQLRESNRADTEKRYREFYAATYPSITVRVPFDIRDDRQANEFRTLEEYAIQPFWKSEPGELRPKAEIGSGELLSFLTVPRDLHRRGPLGLSAPRHFVQEMRVEFPEPFPMAPVHEAIDTPVLRFAHDVSVKERVLTIRSELETRADAVPAADVAAYHDDLERIDRSLGLVLYDDAPTLLPKGLRDVNWPLVVIAIGSLVFSAAVVVWFARRQPAGADDDAEAVPARRIGGWLILLAIGVALTPVLMVRELIFLAPMFSAPLWRQFTTPGAEQYHGLYELAVMFEVAGHAAILVAAIAVAIWFFQQRRIFRPAYLGLAAATLAFMLIDAALVARIGIDEPAGASETPRVLLGTLVWGAYLYRSRRARETFVR